MESHLKQRHTIQYLLTFTSFEKESATAAPAALLIDRGETWDLFDGHHHVLIY